MAKARRMKEKERKQTPKIIRYVGIILVLVAIVFLVLLYLVKTNKVTFSSEIYNVLKFNDVEKTIGTELIYENLDNNSSSEKSSDELSSESSDKQNNELIVLLDESTIINSKKLKSDGITITDTSNDSCMISTTIHNISNKKIKNIKLALYLYNSSGAEISSFNFSVDSILPSYKSSLFTISNLDLKEAHYYSLVLKK